jgi:hypothetical protein
LDREVWVRTVSLALVKTLNKKEAFSTDANGRFTDTRTGQRPQRFHVCLTVDLQVSSALRSKCLQVAPQFEALVLRTQPCWLSLSGFTCNPAICTCHYNVMKILTSAISHIDIANSMPAPTCSPSGASATTFFNILRVETISGRRLEMPADISSDVFTDKVRVDMSKGQEYQ